MLDLGAPPGADKDGVDSGRGRKSLRQGQHGNCSWFWKPTSSGGGRLKENGDLAPHDTREHGVARGIDRIIAEHARGVLKGAYSDDFRDEPDKPFEGAAALQLLSSMSSPRVASPPRAAILRRYPARPSKGVAAATYTNLPGPLADEQEQMRSISSAVLARIATRL